MEKTEELKVLQGKLIQIVKMRASGMLKGIEDCLEIIEGYIPKKHSKKTKPFMDCIRKQSEDLKKLSVEEVSKRFQN